MKRAGNLIQQIADLENLYLAFYKARKGKDQRIEVIEYATHLDYNIKLLQNHILSGELNVGNYTYFTISDPKIRQICAASFPERVLHHAIMNICHEVFERHLIFDTYATRKEKGIYLALEKAKCSMKKYSYVAKLDVRKYFDNVNHQVLKEKLQHLFKDHHLLGFFEQIIESYQTKEGGGIPIGNLKSQYFANFYFSAADRFAKHELKIPVYLRYMDDILIFENDKVKLFDQVSQFCSFVGETMQLQFKPLILNRVDQGISFLGYKLYPNIIILNSRSKNRFKEKFRDYAIKLEKDQWTQKDYHSHILPLLSFAKHAYTKKLRVNLLTKFETSIK